MGQTLFTFAIALIAQSVFSVPVVHAANTKWYNAKQVKFSIDLPSDDNKDWLVGPILGFPLAVLAPNKDGLRPTLSLTPEITPSHGSIDMDQVKIQIGSYQNGRKNYVENRKGQIKEFFEPIKIENKHNLDIYALGYAYTIDNKDIVERSIRFMCDGHLVLGMTRHYPDHHQDAEQQFNHIFKNLKCKKASGKKK